MLCALRLLSMSLTTLNAISPIDGRYTKKTVALSPFFSEFALIYYRLLVEIHWLKSLAANPSIIELPELDEPSKQFLADILKQFDESQAELVKAYERETNHDV